MKEIIGIDLGTTNSCVAIIKGSLPTIVVNNEDRPVFQGIFY